MDIRQLTAKELTHLMKTTTDKKLMIEIIKYVLALKYGEESK